MIARTVTPPVAGDSLKNLLDMGDHASFPMFLIMETPATNTNPINYGDRVARPFTIAATGVTTEQFFINRAADFYLSGDGTDVVHVFLTPR